MKIKLWGTRGSIPTPSTETFQTSKFGGDTTCLSVESGGKLVILDAGSGIRLLGLDMLKRKQREAFFFFTHVHWDHIQGFPFFIPAFVEDNAFEMYGPRLKADTPGFVGGVLEKALRGQQHYLNFPVRLDEMPSKMKFNDLDEYQKVEIPVDGGKLIVSAALLNHPGGSFGYRIEEHLDGEKSKIFTLATDTEHFEEINPNLQHLAKDADAMIYDAQYTEDEYNGVNGMSKVGWGHSTWRFGLREAVAAKVKRMILFHHDPMHDDDTVSAMEQEAREAGKKQGVEIEAARQLGEIQL